MRLNFQVEDLKSASKSLTTLESMIQLDIEQETVKQAGSHTRNLLRVKRGLDMVRVLFEQILSTEYVIFIFFLSLENPISSPLFLTKIIVKYETCLFVLVH